MIDAFQTIMTWRVGCNVFWRSMMIVDVFDAFKKLKKILTKIDDNWR